MIPEGDTNTVLRRHRPLLKNVIWVHIWYKFELIDTRWRVHALSEWLHFRKVGGSPKLFLLCAPPFNFLVTNPIFRIVQTGSKSRDITIKQAMSQVGFIGARSKDTLSLISSPCSGFECVAIWSREGNWVGMMACSSSGLQVNKHALCCWEYQRQAQVGRENTSESIASIGKRRL